MNSLPEGKMARTGVASVAAIKMGVSTMTHRVKRPFMSEESKQKHKQSLDDKNAHILFKALTQLRGTALKVAQMIGMDQGLLPESYRTELEKSFHQVPPLNRVLVSKVLEQELKGTADTLFKDFDHTAFAAASLGQVHKATLLSSGDSPKTSKNNITKVAVKVQYPGINVAIESDLTLIRGVARGLSNNKIILQTLNEIEARLKEEVDYTIEARNTNWFREHVTLEKITIPKVYSDTSSKRILTTEFIEGMHLDDWLETNPTQTCRNETAQRLYDFFVHCSQELQCLHADPNPGNYLFHEDGSISVIDFGCVRHLSDQFTAVFPKLIAAYLNDDPQALFTAYEAIGMTYEDTEGNLYKNILRPFGEWVTLPFKQASFDFGKHADYTQLGKEPVKNLHDKITLDRIAEEFIFHNRTIYGLCQIFERMGAEVRIRHHWELI